MAKTKKSAPKVKKTSFSLFQWLDEISYNKRDWNLFNNEQKDSFLPFLIHRFISMNKDYIEIVNMIQKYNVSSEVVYNFYKNILPKRKQFFKYIKKSKKDIDKELIEALCVMYEVGTKEAEEYCDLLTEDEIDEIKLQILQK